MDGEKDIKHATRKHYSTEKKITVVLDRLLSGDNTAELCFHEDNLITQLTRHNLRYPAPVKRRRPFQNPTKGRVAPFGNPKPRAPWNRFQLI